MPHSSDRYGALGIALTGLASPVPLFPGTGEPDQMTLRLIDEVTRNHPAEFEAGRMGVLLEEAKGL